MPRKFITVGTAVNVYPTIPATGDNFDGAITTFSGFGFGPFSTPSKGWATRAAGSSSPYAYSDFVQAPQTPLPSGMEFGSILSYLSFGISECEYTGHLGSTGGFVVGYENRITPPIILNPAINSEATLSSYPVIDPPLGSDPQQQVIVNIVVKNYKGSIDSARITRTRALTGEQNIPVLLPYEYSYGYWENTKIYPDVLPSYMSLVTGYSLDNRQIPTTVSFTPNFSGLLNIEYYSSNPLESIPNLTSLDHVSLSLDVIKDKAYKIDVPGIVIGTFSSSPPINPVNIVGEYNWTEMNYDDANLAALFTKWRNLYSIMYPDVNGEIKVTPKHTLRLIAANNNVWNNNSTIYKDINFDIDHPLFKVDDDRAYNWHIIPQSDGSIGALIMDSPRTIEIHAALEASKYLKEVPAVIGTGTADNPQTPAIHTLGYSIANGGGQKLTEIHKALDAEKYSKVEGSNIPRVATLGHLISKISAILGYRPEPDGSFTEDAEKKLVRKIVSSTEKIDKKKIGVNNFGSDGMLLRRLNNRFNGDKIANDECVIVKDLPQLLAEYQDQINLALGLQESSAVEIKNNSETSRYSNQLAMLSELLNLASSNHDMIRAALISSLIAQGQTSETIAALGLPTVTKTLPIDVDGKITHLPYKGVAPHRSISQEVATCTQNVGIVLGQLL